MHGLCRQMLHSLPSGQTEPSSICHISCTPCANSRVSHSVHSQRAGSPPGNPSFKCFCDCGPGQQALTHWVGVPQVREVGGQPQTFCIPKYLASSLQTWCPAVAQTCPRCLCMTVHMMQAHEKPLHTLGEKDCTDMALPAPFHGCPSYAGTRTCH